MSDSQLRLAHFFDHVGGLNTTDSPFKISDGQATSGFNYDYALTGGFSKRGGNVYTNTVADAKLRTLGMSQWVSGTGSKGPIRAADTVLQTSTDSWASNFTTLTKDTLAAPSTLFSSNQPVVFSQFNNASASVLWCAGGGLTTLHGVYAPSSSPTKFTENGVTPPNGAFTATQAATGGSWASTGTYFYTLAYRKASTQALSNAALEVSVTILNVTDKSTIDLSGLTGLDTTLIDKIYLYRSAVAGTSGFTTGDLVAQINSSATTYVDTGSYISTAQNVPRVGNTLLDNSVLSSGTYNTVTTFKRRLVAASGNTFYLSDLNKSESWPASNVFTIPSGGPITALGVISFTTATSTNIDELLVIFTQRETWILTGSSLTDWTLKFLANVGCVGQAALANAGDILCWLDYSGFYIWDGSGKPVYVSRPIENNFSASGSFDKANFVYAWAAYSSTKKQVIWHIADTVEGVNQVSVKLDLRLTLPSLQGGLGPKTIDGVFCLDNNPYPLYGGAVNIPTTSEVFFAGDASGFVYNMYSGLKDQSSTDIDFQYGSKFFDMGSPGVSKRFHKVIVWAKDTTDASLTLDYWTKYHAGENDKAGGIAQVSTQVSDGTWDIGSWDAAYWDDVAQSYNPIVYNLGSALGNEGDCIRIRLSHVGINAPISIAGFTIVYSESGLRK